MFEEGLGERRFSPVRRAWLQANDYLQGSCLDIRPGGLGTSYGAYHLIWYGSRGLLALPLDSTGDQMRM